MHLIVFGTDWSLWRLCLLYLSGWPCLCWYLDAGRESFEAGRDYRNSQNIMVFLLKLRLALIFSMVISCMGGLIFSIQLVKDVYGCGIPSFIFDGHSFLYLRSCSMHLMADYCFL